MNSYRIVFFGTSVFGIPILEALRRSPHPLVACVTTPDKPKGRSLKIQASPIKSWATSNGIDVLAWESVKTAEAQEALRALDADIFVVASYGLLLPQSMLDIPKIASINVHASLLPKYRGASPIHSALLKGDMKTGVTIMRMVERLDAGPILSAEECELDFEMDYKTLETKLALIGSKKLLDQLAKSPEPSAWKGYDQNEDQATYSPKIQKHMGSIDWKLSAESIHNQVRAFHQWPKCFTYWDQSRLLILKTQVDSATSKIIATPGQVVSASKADGIRVSCGEGVIQILSLQPEGKNMMNAAEFLRGYPFNPSTVLHSKTKVL